MNIPLVAVLWNKVGLTGHRRTIVENIPDLNMTGFNDCTASVEVRPGPDYEAFKSEHDGKEPTVVLCEHAHFEGVCIELRAGKYEDLGTVNLDNMISSIQIPFPGDQKLVDGPILSVDPDAPSKHWPSIYLVVELYEHAFYNGWWATVLEDVRSIPRYLGDFRSSGDRSLLDVILGSPSITYESANDRFSSIKVRKGPDYFDGCIAVAWEHAGASPSERGIGLELQPGDYANLKHEGFNDRISAIEITQIE